MPRHKRSTLAHTSLCFQFVMARTPTGHDNIRSGYFPAPWPKYLKKSLLGDSTTVVLPAGMAS